MSILLPPPPPLPRSLPVVSCLIPASACVGTDSRPPDAKVQLPAARPTSTTTDSACFVSTHFSALKLVCRVCGLFRELAPVLLASTNQNCQTDGTCIVKWHSLSYLLGKSPNLICDTVNVFQKDVACFLVQPFIQSSTALTLRNAL